MKSSLLVLTALLAAAWASSPAPARADNDGDKKGKVVEKDVRIERGGDEGDREREGGGDWDRGGGREGGGSEFGPRSRPGGPGKPGGGTGPGWMRGGPSPELRARFDKIRELEEKLRDLGRKLAVGSDADKTAGKAEVRKVVGELFDTKMALDASMIELAEKNLVDMKAKLAKRKANRDRAIESRVARVAGEADDWD